MTEHACNGHLETALLALSVGLSPVPPRDDGTKAPLADVPTEDGKTTWLPYQTAPATEEHVRHWYKNGRTGNGLATGYGGVECFEFDNRDVYDDFLEAATEAGLGGLVDRIRTGYEEFSPGGGVHWLYRCAEPSGNAKLAERPDPNDPNKRDVLIETRGRGGFIIIAPSTGRVHPTGGAYTRVSGGLDLMVALWPDEREALWQFARTFDEMPEASRADPEPPKRKGGMKAPVTGGFPEAGTKPGDDFNDRESWENILEPRGWVKVFTRGAVTYWRRPGKDHAWSATTGHCKGLKVFSASTSFKTEGTYTKFGAYAVLEHGGDFKEATKALAEKGYGTWIDDDGKEHQNPAPKTAGKRRTNQHQSQSAKAAAQDDYRSLSDDDMGIITASSVQERPIDWLWEYRLAAGEMALLAGDGGLGKSSLLLAITALITTGGKWPDGSGIAPVGDVIIISAEDSRETTLKPRLIALGANLDRVKFVTAKLTIQKPGEPPMVHPMTLQDCYYWRDVLRRVPSCKLLIVDPIPSYLGRGVNDAKNSELRAVIEPFIETVIRPVGAGFIGNTHLNKNIDSKTPMHRITGSMAYGNLPRNVHFVVADPDKPDRMFFKQAKCNNAPRNLPAIAYSLVRADIPSAGGQIETSYPVFEAETVQVDDLQAAMSSKRGKPGPAPEKTTKVAVWLLGYLRSHPGPSLMRDVFDAAGAMGFVGVQKPNDSGYLRWSVPGTLYRAKDEIAKLVSPDDGWMVDDSKVGKLVYWEAVRS